MSDPIDQGTQNPSARPPGAPKRKRSASMGQVLAGILLVLVVVFFAENTTHVKIRLIAGPKVNAPVWVALVIAAVVGALISALLRYRRKRHNS